MTANTGWNVVPPPLVSRPENVFYIGTEKGGGLKTEAREGKVGKKRSSRQGGRTKEWIKGTWGLGKTFKSGFDGYEKERAGTYPWTRKDK